MIYHVVTAHVNTGKMAQMAEWSQKVAGAIKANHGVEIDVLRNVAGSGNNWHFYTTHDSLAALEQYTTAVAADPQFLALAQDAGEMQLWSTTTTHIFRSAF